MEGVTEPTDGPGRPAVAVAVVTGRLGVLVGRRRDGNPPWTFPGGKIEPGESSEDAAVRETLEEAGLRVRATGVIGSRVHPATGFSIVYMAALADEITIPPLAEDGELTEVRWVSVAEVRKLMPDLSSLVAEHLYGRDRQADEP